MANKTNAQEVYAVIVSSAYIPILLVQFETLKSFSSKRFAYCVLCVDYDSYIFLKNLKIDNMITVFWEDLNNQTLRDQRKKHGDRIANFCWVCKTFFMEYLLDQYEFDKLLYIDSDLYPLSDPSSLFDLWLEQYDICLTPHYYSPYLKQIKMHERCGEYNAGFVGITSKARPFLQWWQEKTCEKCEMDATVSPAEGSIDDQGYLDSAKALFPKVKDLGPQYNIGPWNLHNVCFDGGSLFINKQKVIFYHFHQLRVEDWEVRHNIRRGSIFNIDKVCKIYDYFNQSLQKVKNKYCSYFRSKKIELIELCRLDDNNKELFQDMSFLDLINYMYNLASKLKGMDDLKKAKELFGQIIKTPLVISDSLRGGAYFHLGEIYYAEGRQHIACDLFQKCIIRNPSHRKALEYLKSNEYTIV